jgi:hypothetical protein
MIGHPESARRARKGSMVRSETANPLQGAVPSGSNGIVRGTPEDPRTPNPARASTNKEKSRLNDDRAQVPLPQPRVGPGRASAIL